MRTPPPPILKVETACKKTTFISTRKSLFINSSRWGANVELSELVTSQLTVLKKIHVQTEVDFSLGGEHVPYHSRFNYTVFREIFLN